MSSVGGVDRIYPELQCTKTWAAHWSSSVGSMAGQHPQRRDRPLI